MISDCLVVICSLECNKPFIYRENAIVIESEETQTVVMCTPSQCKFTIPECARKERNLHCDVVHITTVWVSRLVLDDAIAAIQTSR